MSDFTNCLSKDRARLYRLRAAVRRNPVDSKAEQQLAHTLARSQAGYLQRQQQCPEARIDAELPVGLHAEQLIALIRGNPVVVVAGETGSGKTTQLPKICLAAGRGIAGMIGCTQPRRIAARAVASRVADELQSRVGAAVGFQVRFNEQVGEQTYLKFMTDGILLAEIKSDPWLSRYDTLIIDEAHERSLNIDFLLGYLKNLLAKRSDLKLIITSATIDTARFAAHFNNAPVLAIEGRSHPVTVRYRDFNDDSTATAVSPSRQSARERAEDLTLSDKIVRTVDEITIEDGLGDILVFLPGEREIRESHLALAKRNYRNTEILPLYARLSIKDQDRVFRPESGRRIILATNVAETSLTVPRIRYVIDPGIARIKRYSPRQKMDRLQLEPISQASANQRKGRCGRVTAGICYRLYAETDFEQRPAFTDPEIKRCALAGVILRMLSLKLGELQHFPFIDMPDLRAINDGWQSLVELGAIDSRRQLNEVGRQMARLPVDVKLARMLVAANGLGVLHEMAVVAAFMGISDPRERPADAKQAADSAHRLFQHPSSEFLGIIQLWRAFRQTHDDSSQSQLRKWCERHFLSYLRMREWRELHRQLLIVCQELDWPLQAWDDIEAQLSMHQGNAKAAAAHYRQFHSALLPGLPAHIGHRNDKGLFDAPRQRRFTIFPASPLAKQAPAWCLAGQLLDTQKVWGLLCAKIEPDWAIEACPHLLTRHYFDPHWSRHQGRVVGFCQISLLGLQLLAKKPVHYGALFPEAARAIFIQQALLTGEINCRAGFIARNLEVLNDALEEESKQRRIGLVVDEDWQTRWYADRIPAEICSAESLDKWARKLTDAEKKRLYWTRDDLLVAEHSAEAQFPHYFAIGDKRLALHYRFAPGQDDDGVSLTVPLHLLNALDPARLSWLVPGLLEEKAAELIRALPKTQRRNYVPTPDFARAFAQAYPLPEADSLHGCLARFLSRTTGVAITALDFDEAVLAPHLRMNLQLLDTDGLMLAQSRDLAALREQYATLAEQAFSAQAGQSFSTEPVLVFPAEPIPESLQTPEGLIAYPALALQGSDVRLHVFATAEDAKRQHDAGVRHLLRLALTEACKSAAKQLPVDAKLGLLYATLESAERLRQDCVQAACKALLAADCSEIRTHAQFDAAKIQYARQLFAHSMAVLQLLQECMHANAKIRALLEPSLMGWASANRADARAHLQRLIYPGFLTKTEPALLQHLPRFLKALQTRMERALQDPVKDQARMLDLQPFNAALQNPVLRETADFAAFRLAVEELNVQVYAQELSPKGVVSRKAVAKQLARLISHA